MQEIWQFVHRHLSNEVPVALAVVTHHEGYPPGKRGFKMALTAEGHRLGTVGGGIIEHEVLLTNRGLLDKKAQRGHLTKVTVPALQGVGKDEPCAGRQWIAMTRLGLKDKETVQQIVQALDRKVEGVITLTPSGLEFQEGPAESHDRIHGDRIHGDRLHCDRLHGDRLHGDRIHGDRIHGDRFNEDGDTWIYRERTGFPNRAFLIGGGHVNWALSRILATLNFQILVFDPRMDLDTLQENQHAHQKIVVPYTQIGDYMIEGKKSYVVIATPDVTTDIEAMRQVLDRDWKYVGLMGDQTKLAFIADQLAREGFPRKVFKKITCPTGSAITPRTVSEIAISIAAQIIQVKNRND